MFLLNYQLSLPRTFDVAALRERIPSIGARFDATPGLGAKAFLVREQGVDGSPLNQYAPFYLFTDETAAATFLWGGTDFTGVAVAYGRPIAQTWIGGGYQRGPAIGETPRWAVRTVSRLPQDEAPEPVAAAAREALAARADEPALHSVAFGIDPRGWELVVFSMHTAKPDPADGELYDVVHLSAPDEASLPAIA